MVLSFPVSHWNPFRSSRLSVFSHRNATSQPVKSMQRAASSDTLSTIALGSGADQPQRSLHDAKQHLCHSQSMVLPENGKVRTGTNTLPVCLCVYSRDKNRVAENF